MLDIHVISHTHWDREWYLTHEQFRFRLVALVDRLLDLLDADPRLQAFPSRRPDHRARGLPRDPARAGGAAAQGDRGRPHPDRPVVRDAGRVSRQRRVAGPQPAARPSHLARVRHADAGRLPAGPVRPRRPDAADLAAVRPRQHHPLARLRRRERRVLVGRAGRLAAADDAPAAGRLLQRDAHRLRSRRDDGAREGEGRLRARPHAHRPGAADERRRPRRAAHRDSGADRAAVGDPRPARRALDAARLRRRREDRRRDANSRRSRPSSASCAAAPTTRTCSPACSRPAST